MQTYDHGRSTSQGLDQSSFHPLPASSKARSKHLDVRAASQISQPPDTNPPDNSGLRTRQSSSAFSAAYQPHIPTIATTQTSFGSQGGPGRRSRAFPSSATWTSSSGDLAMFPDSDDVEDRTWFVEEYNRLAQKHGIRKIFLDDAEKGKKKSPPATMQEKRSWWTRMKQASSHGSQGTLERHKRERAPSQHPRGLRHSRSVSNLAQHLVHGSKEPSSSLSLQTIVRLSGKSLLYLPPEYACNSLLLPTCFRATAQYLVQNGVVTRGVFRISGSLRVVNALYGYYCHENKDEDVTHTIRHPNLPTHIKAGVYEVASVFKRLLGALPGGILGSVNLFDALVAIYSQLHTEPEFNRTRQTKLRARLIALAIGTLQSQFQRELICAVFGLLSLIGRQAEIAPHEDEQGRPLPTSDLMGYNALGIIFGPLLVGDLLDSYTMKLAHPPTGLLVFPLMPTKLKKERAGSAVATEGPPPVDKIRVVNDITEMLITHWREVVRHLGSLSALAGKGRPGEDEKDEQVQLQPSTSEPFIKNRLRLDVDTVPREARDRATSPITGPSISKITSIPANSGSTLTVKRSRPKVPKATSSQRISARLSLNPLSPTAEESVGSDHTPHEPHKQTDKKHTTTLDSHQDHFLKAAASTLHLSHSKRHPSDSAAAAKSSLGRHQLAASLRRDDNASAEFEGEDQTSRPASKTSMLRKENLEASQIQGAAEVSGEVSARIVPSLPACPSEEHEELGRRNSIQKTPQRLKQGSSYFLRGPGLPKPFNQALSSQASHKDQLVRDDGLPMHQTTGDDLQHENSRRSDDRISQASSKEEAPTSQQPANSHSTTSEPIHGTVGSGQALTRRQGGSRDVALAPSPVISSTPNKPIKPTVKSSDDPQWSGGSQIKFDRPADVAHVEMAGKNFTRCPGRRSFRKLMADSAKAPRESVNNSETLQSDVRRDRKSTPSGQPVEDQNGGNKGVSFDQGTETVKRTPSLQDLDWSLNLGTMVPHQEQPPVDKHLSFSRPPPTTSSPSGFQNDGGGLPEHASEVRKVQSRSSSLHGQVRTLQKQLDSRVEEITSLRRQLDAKANLDIGTLSEQLRRARRDRAMWKERAETAERRVAVFEIFMAKLKNIQTAGRNGDGVAKGTGQQFETVDEAPRVAQLDGEFGRQNENTQINHGMVTEEPDTLASRVRRSMRDKSSAQGGSARSSTDPDEGAAAGLSETDLCMRAAGIWTAAQELLAHEALFGTPDTIPLTG